MRVPRANIDSLVVGQRRRRASGPGAPAAKANPKAATAAPAPPATTLAGAAAEDDDEDDDELVGAQEPTAAPAPAPPAPPSSHHQPRRHHDRPRPAPPRLASLQSRQHPNPSPNQGSSQGQSKPPLRHPLRAWTAAVGVELGDGSERRRQPRASQQQQQQQQQQPQQSWRRLSECCAPPSCVAVNAPPATRWRSNVASLATLAPAPALTPSSSSSAVPSRLQPRHRHSLAWAGALQAAQPAEGASRQCNHHLKQPASVLKAAAATTAAAPAAPATTTPATTTTATTMATTTTTATASVPSGVVSSAIGVKDDGRTSAGNSSLDSSTSDEPDEDEQDDDTLDVEEEEDGDNDTDDNDTDDGDDDDDLQFGKQTVHQRHHDGPTFAAHALVGHVARRTLAGRAPGESLIVELEPAPKQTQEAIAEAELGAQHLAGAASSLAAAGYDDAGQTLGMEILRKLPLANQQINQSNHRRLDDNNNTNHHITCQQTTDPNDCNANAHLSGQPHQQQLQQQQPDLTAQSNQFHQLQAQQLTDLRQPQGPTDIHRRSHLPNNTLLADLNKCHPTLTDPWPAPALKCLRPGGSLLSACLTTKRSSSASTQANTGNTGDGHQLDSPIDQLSHNERVKRRTPISTSASRSRFQFCMPQQVTRARVKIKSEDYDKALSELTGDIRYQLHLLLYNRVHGLWLFLTTLLCVAAPFVLLTQVELFILGVGTLVGWLVLQLFGALMAVHCRRKLNDMLERSVAQANTFFMEHNLMIGVINVGSLFVRSRLAIPLLYFDTSQCREHIESILRADSRCKAPPQSDDKSNNNNHNNNSNNHHNYDNNQNAIHSNGGGHILDFSKIGLPLKTANTVALAQSQLAKKIILKYSQKWISYFDKQKLMFIDDRMQPRHLSTGKCLCQFIEEHFDGLDASEPYLDELVRSLDQQSQSVPQTNQKLNGHQSQQVIDDGYLKDQARRKVDVADAGSPVAVVIRPKYKKHPLDRFNRSSTSSLSLMKKRKLQKEPRIHVRRVQAVSASLNGARREMHLKIDMGLGDDDGELANNADGYREAKENSLKCSPESKDLPENDINSELGLDNPIGPSNDLVNKLRLLLELRQNELQGLDGSLFSDALQKTSQFQFGLAFPSDNATPLSSPTASPLPPKSLAALGTTPASMKRKATNASQLQHSSSSSSSSSSTSSSSSSATTSTGGGGLIGGSTTTAANVEIKQKPGRELLRGSKDGGLVGGLFFFGGSNGTKRTNTTGVLTTKRKTTTDQQNAIDHHYHHRQRQQDNARNHVLEIC